jgi:hypothetical protein
MLREPEPETPNPKPGAPEPETRSPGTRNPEPEIRDPSPRNTTAGLIAQPGRD